MQEEVHHSPAPREFVGTSMLIGVLVTLAVMALCGRPLFPFSSDELLEDLPWTAVWLVATFAARSWIRRSPKTEALLTSCNAKCYGRFLSENAARGIDRFFFVLFRVTIFIVCAAIIFGVVVVAFYD